ncbi:MAG: hypothetical protein ACO2YU_13880, partial [Paracoccaceae bacterium]
QTQTWTIMAAKPSMQPYAVTRQKDTRLIMAHRPAAIKECDLLLVLEGGAKRAFGPKEDVLRATVQNTESLMRSQALGGMT